MNSQEIQSRIQASNALDLGYIFNNALNLFKKSRLHGFVMQLITMLLILPFMFVLYVPIVMAVIADSGAGDFDIENMDSVFAGLSIAYIIMIVVGILIVSVVSIAINAGFFRMLRTLDLGEQVYTKDLFYFFKGNYVSKMIAIMLISVVIAVPSALMCYIPLIYVIVPISFFVVMFAFNPELTVGEIISNAFRIGTKKWLISIGLIIISSMATSLVSFITCGIGSLFVAPFVYHPIYYIYKEVIGFDDKSEIDSIGEDVRF